MFTADGVTEIEQRDDPDQRGRVHGQWRAAAADHRAGARRRRRRWRSRSPMSIATPRRARDDRHGTPCYVVSFEPAVGPRGARSSAAARGLPLDSFAMVRVCGGADAACAGRSSRPSRPTNSAQVGTGVVAAGAIGRAADVRRRVPTGRRFTACSSIDAHEVNAARFRGAAAGAPIAPTRDAARHARGYRYLKRSR